MCTQLWKWEKSQQVKRKDTSVLSFWSWWASSKPIFRPAQHRDTTHREGLELSPLRACWGLQAGPCLSRSLFWKMKHYRKGEGWMRMCGCFDSDHSRTRPGQAEDQEGRKSLQARHHQHKSDVVSFTMLLCSVWHPCYEGATSVNSLSAASKAHDLKTSSQPPSKKCLPEAYIIWKLSLFLP